MEILKKQLGNTEWMVVTTKEKRVIADRVKRTITDTYPDGKVEERTEVIIKETEVVKESPCVYLFTEKQFDIMFRNYSLGNCAVSEKGLTRYSNAYTPNGTDWYGQPGR